MADQFGGIPVETGSTDQFGGVPVSMPPPTTLPTTGFLANLGSSGANALQGMAHAVVHPIDTAENLATTVAGASPIQGPQGSWQHDVAAPQAAKVGEFYKDRYGNLPAIGHTLYTDPVGAAMDASVVAGGAEAGLRGTAALADVANAGRVASGLRTAADVAGTVSDVTNPLSLAGKGIGAGVNKALNVRSGLSPVESAAVDYALQDSDLSPTADVATTTGNKFLGSAKSLLRKSPASAGMVSDAEGAQQSAIAGKMSDVAESVSPGGASTKLTAGLSAQAKIDAALKAYRDQATTAYGSLLKEAESNPQTLQIGMQRNPSLDPNAPDLIPIMGTLEGPTDTSAVKATAGPILEKLEATIPEAQKQLSPSVSLLRQIMNRPDKVSIETAIADNSAIQNLARTESPALRTQAQGIAATLVKPYRSAIDQAAKDISPAAYQALQDGRDATTAKYELGKLIPKQLGSKPVSVVNLLTAGDDASVPILQTLQKHVPNAIPDVARATIESIFNRTTQNGGISRVDSALAKWNALGDQTKSILFGSDTSQEITNLLQYAKMTTSELNRSGTAGVGQAAGLAALLMRDPMSAIAAMAGSRAMTKGIFNPDLAATVRQTGRVPLPQPGPVTRTIGAVAGAKAINAGRASNAPLNAPPAPIGIGAPGQ